jgi:hypothetical protein
MIRKIIAATCLLAALAFAAPASADGYRHGHRSGHGYQYSHKYYRHDGAAIFAGGLLLGALFGHLAAPPRTVYAAPPPQPVLGNCRTIYGTSYVNGRPAEYSGTGCYDAYGNLYAMPGSERFLRYLD